MGIILALRLARLWCEAYLAVRQSHVFRCSRLNRHIFKAGSSSGNFRAHLGTSGLKHLSLPAFPSLYMKRAARLLSVYEKKETDFVDALTEKKLSPDTAKAILLEAMRGELGKMAAEERQADPLSDADIDQRLAALEAENRRLRRAARNKEWGDVLVLLKEASALVSVGLQEPIR